MEFLYLVFLEAFLTGELFSSRKLPCQEPSMCGQQSSLQVNSFV